MEKSMGFPDAELYVESFEKNFKKSNILETRHTLKILGVAISSHLFFFSVFADLENQNWSIRSGRISCNRGKGFDYLKWKDFRANRKNFLLVSQCLQRYSGDHGDLYISSS